LAKNLENRIQKAGAILEITSKLPQVRDAPYADLLNQTLTTLHGIPQQAEIEIWLKLMRQYQVEFSVSASLTAL
jgi:hypothetical protein